MAYALQGAHATTGVGTYLFVSVAGEDDYRATQSTATHGWMTWSNPRITGLELEAGDVVTVGLAAHWPSGHWGTLDDFFFFMTGDGDPSEPDPGPGEPEPDDAENLLANDSFEDPDMSMWRIGIAEGSGAGIASGAGVGRGTENPRTDAHALRWWYPNALDFTIEQDLEIDVAGTYAFETFVTGDDGAPQTVYAYVLVNGRLAGRADAPRLPGWGSWTELAVEGIELAAGDIVTVGARVCQVFGVSG